MLKKSTFPVIGASIILSLSAGMAFAKEHDKETQKDVATINAVRGATLRLADAIVLTERHTNGRAVEAETENEDGKVFYEIKTISGGHVHETEMDMQNGNILKSESEGLLSRIKDVIDRDEYKSALGAKVSLATAVKNAEQAFGGVAMEADFEAEEDANFYEIKLVGKNGIMLVAVNAVDGTSSVFEEDTEQESEEADRIDDENSEANDHAQDDHED